jgi:hypothetical protein
VEWGERTKLDAIKLHELRLAQWQPIQQGARLFGGCNIHEENRGLSDPDEPTIGRFCQPNKAELYLALPLERSSLLARVSEGTRIVQWPELLLLVLPGKGPFAFPVFPLSSLEIYPYLNPVLIGCYLL